MDQTGRGVDYYRLRQVKRLHQMSILIDSPTWPNLQSIRPNQTLTSTPIEKLALVVLRCPSLRYLLGMPSPDKYFSCPKTKQQLTHFLFFSFFLIIVRIKTSPAAVNPLNMTLPETTYQLLLKEPTSFELCCAKNNPDILII